MATSGSGKTRVEVPPARKSGSSPFGLVVRLAVLIGVVAVCYKLAARPPVQLLTINPDGDYDMNPIVAPVLSGAPLKFFTAVLRTPLIGSFLLSKISNDNKFYEILNFASSLPHPSPLFRPYRLPSRQELQELQDSYTLAELEKERARKSNNESASPMLGAQEHLTDSRIVELHDLYKTGRVSPVDVVKRVFEAIHKSNLELSPKLNAFIRYREGAAIKEAELSAERFKRGTPASLMDGVPVGVKIEFAVDGQPFSLGTALRTQLATHDDEPVSRLKRAGSIIVGLTNMQEIGIGVFGFNQFYGTARNPYNLSFHTGGSSSGSASAVAAGLVPVALAADGGGSIRIPAGFNGVMGLKPTTDRVVCGSEIAWSVGTAGPIATTADDLRIALGIIGAGPGSMPQPALTYRGYPNKDLKGLRVGVFEAYNAKSHPQVYAAVQRTIDFLTSKGAIVVPIKVPHLQAMFHGHVITILSEMAASTMNFDARLDEYGYVTQINLLLARHLSGAHYVSAQIARQWFFDHVRKILSEVDVMVCPNTAIPAPRIVNTETGETNLQATAEIMRFAFMANFLGLPAATIPVALTQHESDEVPAGLPIAVQLIGAHWTEPRLLRLSKIIHEKFPIAPPKVFYGPAYDAKKF